MSTRVPRAASICSMCPFYLHLFVVSFFREAVPKFSIGPIDNRQQFKVSFLFICCGRKAGMRRMGGKSFLGLRANFSLKVNMWHRNLIKLLIVWLIVAAAANAFIATPAKATGKSWCRSYLAIILALTFGKVFAFHLAPQEIDFWCLDQLFFFSEFSEMEPSPQIPQNLSTTLCTAFFRFFSVYFWLRFCQRTDTQVRCYNPFDMRKYFPCTLFPHFPHAFYWFCISSKRLRRWCVGNWISHKTLQVLCI